MLRRVGQVVLYGVCGIGTVTWLVSLYLAQMVSYTTYAGKTHQLAVYRGGIEYSIAVWQSDQRRLGRLQYDCLARKQLQADSHAMWGSFEWYVGPRAVGYHQFIIRAPFWAIVGITGALSILRYRLMVRQSRR